MKYPTIQNRDGADAETVVCALFHDVGEVLNHVNHGEIGFSNHDDCEEQDYEDEEDGDEFEEDYEDEDDDVMLMGCLLLLLKGEIPNHVYYG